MKDVRAELKSFSADCAEMKTLLKGIAVQLQAQQKSSEEEPKPTPATAAPTLTSSTASPALVRASEKSLQVPKHEDEDEVEAKPDSEKHSCTILEALLPIDSTSANSVSGVTIDSSLLTSCNYIFATNTESPTTSPREVSDPRDVAEQSKILDDATDRIARCGKELAEDAQAFKQGICDCNYKMQLLQQKVASSACRALASLRIDAQDIYQLQSSSADQKSVIELDSDDSSDSTTDDFEDDNDNSTTYDPGDESWSDDD